MQCHVRARAWAERKEGSDRGCRSSVELMDDRTLRTPIYLGRSLPEKGESHPARLQEVHYSGVKLQKSTFLVWSVSVVRVRSQGEGILKGDSKSGQGQKGQERRKSYNNGAYPNPPRTPFAREMIAMHTNLDLHSTALFLPRLERRACTWNSNLRGRILSYHKKV